MTKRVFLNRTTAYSKVKGDQRIVKRKSRSGRTVWILRKRKHFYTTKPSKSHKQSNKKHGIRHLHRHSGKRKQRAKKS